MKKVGLLSVKLFLFLIVFSIGSLFINIYKSNANTAQAANATVTVPSPSNAVTQTEKNLAICNKDGNILNDYLVCPIINLANKGILNLTIGSVDADGTERKSVLISFLELPPLNSKGSPLAAVMKNIINVVNGFYVIVFLVLIFAGSLPFNIDNYTVKKMLPKLIAAIILTQFSIVICGAIIDFFNLLGLIVPNILFGLLQVSVNVAGQPATGASAAINGVGGVLAGGVGVGAAAGGIAAAASGFGWILLMIIFIIALISAFIAVIYLLLRYFILYLLVLISPLAFAAWVIPGTSKFFTNWWTTFIRLNAMFVTIMALMSGSVVLAAVLNAQTGSWIPALFPVVALLLIPKTLKWTTQGMNSLASGALGFVGGKASGVAKQAGSAAYKKGKTAGIEAKNKQAAIQFGKHPEGSWQRKAATLAAGKLPTTKGELQMSQQAAAYREEEIKNNRTALKNRSQTKGIDHGTYMSELRKVASGGESAVLGLNAAANPTMQLSAMNELAEAGEWDTIRQMHQTGEITPTMLAEGIQPYIGDASAKAPDLVKGGDIKAGYEGISAEKIAGLDKSSIQTMTKFMADPGTDASTRKYLEDQLRRLHSDKSLSAKLDRTSKEHLNAYAISARMQTQKLDAAGQPMYTNLRGSMGGKSPVMEQVKFD
jgi:hypothetical protein